MKAMVLPEIAPIGERPLVARELPDPEPGEGEVRVRVRVCAICRTDLHLIEGDLPGRGLPRIPGHQVVGVVDRIPESRYTGYHADGGYAELALVREDLRRLQEDGIDGTGVLLVDPDVTG